jgi:rare lipoprotein A
MTRIAWLALPLALAGCSFNAKPPAPVAHVSYTVGKPYQIDGVWQYPRESFDDDETGLAVVAPDHTGLTADGEVFDQTALAGGHHWLQLPCVVRVTNLENGRQILLRLNDRGPDNPGRLLVMTRRAAELLAVQSPVTRVRVQVDEDESRRVSLALQAGALKLDIAAAPPGAVQSESLAPPGGVKQELRAPVAARAAPGGVGVADLAPAGPERLPETVVQTVPHPGGLYIDLGYFSRADAAVLRVNQHPQLGAQVITSFTAPRERAYHVRIGPLRDVAAADAMLQRALGAGVSDAAIDVE